MLERLEVDVARLVADGLADDEVHETDDRRLLRHRLDVVLRQFTAFSDESAAADFLQQIVNALLVLAVVLLDLHVDLVGVGKKQTDAAAEREREIVDGLRVEGIGDEQIDVLVVSAQRHHAVVAREFARHGGDGLAGKLSRQLAEKIVAEMIRDAAK